MKIKEPFLRTEHNYDRNAASQESALNCPEPTLTKQEFLEESDINYIANRYALTGEMPQVLQLPTYGDFTATYDFQTAQNAVIAAREAFMTLPAKLRNRFNNNPQELLQFLHDPTNREEAQFLGLVKRPPTTTETTDGQPAPGTTEAPPRKTKEGPRDTRAPKDTARADPAQEPGHEAN